MLGIHVCPQLSQGRKNENGKLLFRVLQGAWHSIEKNMVDVIQFDFNTMNIISRSFFQDFFDLFEIFAFQNVVAIRKGCGVQV